MGFIFIFLIEHFFHTDHEHINICNGTGDFGCVSIAFTAPFKESLKMCFFHLVARGTRTVSQISKYLC